MFERISTPQRTPKNNKYSPISFPLGGNVEFSKIFFQTSTEINLMSPAALHECTNFRLWRHAMYKKRACGAE